MEHQETHIKSNDLSLRNLVVPTLVITVRKPYTREAIRIMVLALPTTTAAQIMFDRPNSVEARPATCPRMLSHPTTQPT